MSQTLTVRSQPPEAMRRPSGLNATQSTPAVCPRRVKTSSPVVVSHSLMVRSSLPVARRRPSGLQASPSTKSVCPRRSRPLAPWKGPRSSLHRTRMYHRLLTDHRPRQVGRPEGTPRVAPGRRVAGARGPRGPDPWHPRSSQSRRPSAEASQRLSGLKATPRTPAVCFSKLRISRPVSASQSLTSPPISCSLTLAEASHRPSGL